MVRSVLPLTFPSVAEIVDWPAATNVANPAMSIVAASGFDDPHTTLEVMSFVAVSAYVPVAWNCKVVPAGAVELAGVTAIETSVAPMTVSCAVPLIFCDCVDVAVIVAGPPGEIPNAVPEELIVATAVFDEVQFTVTGAVEPSEKWPVAVNA
jgi:hypothetical protein